MLQDVQGGDNSAEKGPQERPAAVEIRKADRDTDLAQALQLGLSGLGGCVCGRGRRADCGNGFDHENGLLSPAGNIPMEN